jgi:adenylate kinase
MRVLFTGQTGVDKKRHIESLVNICRAKGVTIDGVFHIGDMMYEESGNIGFPLTLGKILDLPQAQLAILRRLAFNRVNYESANMKNVFVNSHAVFRWNNQLFRAYDVSEVEAFKPDMVVTFIDDVEMVKCRLERLKEFGYLPVDTRYTLKDLMVWREEEVLASEILASVLKVPHYVLGVWLDSAITNGPLEVAYSLMFQSWKRKTYVSYPISEAQGNQELWEKVCRYRRLVRLHLTAFDPLMIGEKRLQGMYERDSLSALVKCSLRDGEVELDRSEIATVLPDIDGQIKARDYKLIDQADMIVAYFPVNGQGRPLIAGGVQSEIEHAHSTTKEIVIVWEAPRHPTPFIELNADKKFDSLEQLEQFLKEVSKPTGQLEMPL